MKKYLLNLFNSSYQLNQKHISYFCNKYGRKGKWLDLGCDDGEWTKK